MPRTAQLLVLHDTDDEGSREALGGLLFAAGKDVEIEWLDERLAVALISPSDLAPDPETVE